MKTCKSGLHSYDNNLVRCPECRKINKVKWHKVNAKHQASKMKLYRQQNVDSIKANKKSWHHNNLEHSRDMQLKYKYGISLEQYKQMFTEQSGLCAVCNKPEKAKRLGKIKDLSVDHCHKTGKVRGLLCQSCNIAEGHLKDAETANKLFNYMKKHESLGMDPDEIIAQEE